MPASMFPLLTALVLGSPSAHAAPQTAAEILEEARAAQRSDRAVQDLRMVLVGRRGQERVRELTMSLKRDGDVLKSHVRFTAPADVAGTQLVVVDHPDRADEQLLWLPALKRITRISGSARKGSFMGSDFSYEDMELTDADQATAELVAQDDTTWTISAVPGGDSSYARVVLVVSKADHLPRTVDYFDAQGTAVKRLTIPEVQTVDGQVVPKVTIMEDLKKGTQTRLEIVDQKLDVPDEQLPDDMFTAAWMERQG